MERAATTPPLSQSQFTARRASSRPACLSAVCLSGWLAGWLAVRAIPVTCSVSVPALPRPSSSPRQAGAAAGTRRASPKEKVATPSARNRSTSGGGRRSSREPGWRTSPEERRLPIPTSVTHRPPPRHCPAPIARRPRPEQTVRATPARVTRRTVGGGRWAVGGGR